MGNTHTLTHTHTARQADQTPGYYNVAGVGAIYIPFLSACHIQLITLWHGDSDD